MSGHEKFYIPHDDLVSLEAAIASLEVATETLETTLRDTIQIMTAKDETILSIEDETVGTGNPLVVVIDEVLSATKATYIRRFNLNIMATDGDPWNRRLSGGTVFVQFDDKFQWGYTVGRGPDGFTYDYAGGADAYKYRGTWGIHDLRIAANTAITAGYLGHYHGVASKVYCRIFYIEGP